MWSEKDNLFKNLGLYMIGENILTQLYGKNLNLKWFGLVPDESQDISDTAQGLFLFEE